jgi:hypothetical protein
MLAGGGRSLADLRMLKRDAALATVLERDRLPSTDAVGDWLRRMGQMGGLRGSRASMNASWPCASSRRA